MTENLPKITVITVTFNLIKAGRETFFRQCVESVHNQTYPNIEHLIIDGASTDGTLDLIREYEEKGWLRCVSEPDEGVCDAMNKGIKIATSDYIMILNSDDYYENNAIELLYNKLISEKADYSFSATHLMNKDGTTYYHLPASDYSVPLFFIYTPFNHEAMICKKSVYNELDPNGYYYHYKEFGTAADYDFENRLILADYKSSFLNNELFHFRMDGNTSPASCSKMTEAQKKHMFFHVKVILNVWKNYYNENDINYSNIKRETISYDAVNKFISDNCSSNKFRFETISYLSKLRLSNYNYKLLISYFLSINVKETINIKKTVFLIFNAIPLLKIKKKDNVTRFYLFGFLPILKIKSK